MAMTTNAACLTIDNKLTENGTTTFSGDTGESRTYVMITTSDDNGRHYDVTFRLYTNEPYISTEITTRIDARDFEIWAANIVTENFTAEQIARKILGLPLFRTEDITPALGHFLRPSQADALRHLADGTEPKEAPEALIEEPSEPAVEIRPEVAQARRPKA